MRTRKLVLLLILLSVEGAARSIAAEPDKVQTGLPDTREIEAAQSRRGLFGQPLNPMSRFGLGWFPEPLRAPEMDLEYSEMRLDYFHSESDHEIVDEAKAEFEQAFGALTIEVELPYTWQRDRGGGEEDTGDPDADEGEHQTDGLSRVEIGLRYPLFQWVSQDGQFDYTCVGAFELALPASSHFGKDTELSPRIYQLVRVGEHFSLQASIAYATLVGPEDAGANAIEYAASLGYTLSQDDLHIPGIVSITPQLEFLGENVLSGEEHGANPLFGVIGVRVFTNSIAFFQPRIGLGYEFPLNHHARDELEWGVLLSLNFEL